MDNKLRLNFKDSLDVIYCHFEKLECLEIFQVTNVLAEKNFFISRQADNIFQLTANSQNRWTLLLHKDRTGGIASAATNGSNLACHFHNNRIIATQIYIPVMKQEVICQPR